MSRSSTCHVCGEKSADLATVRDPEGMRAQVCPACRPIAEDPAGARGGVG